MINKPLKIIRNYGVLNQVRKFNEECYELTEAIIKYEEAKLNHFENYDEDDKNLAYKNIVEEVGDVLVMVKQFIEYYKIEQSEIDKTMDFKIDRQLQRMEWEDDSNV